MNLSRKKVGLALGSGGVRGLAHIGVLKVLLKNNIPIDYITGCSVGAWMGAHYALYQDLDKLTEATISNKKEKFAALLEPTLRGGLVRGDKVLQLLKKYFGNAEFKDLKIPLRIVATDLVSGDSIIFSEGKIVDAIRASISVPYVFAPFAKGNKVFVDGGISNLVPDDIAREMGADIVIAVNLDNFLKNGTLDWKKQGFSKKMTRSIDIMRHYLAQYSLDKADIIIEPNVSVPGIIGWKNFFMTGEDERLIKAGEEEAEKAVGRIKMLLDNK
jgi:NTE family protein